MVALATGYYFYPLWFSHLVGHDFASEPFCLYDILIRIVVQKIQTFFTVLQHKIAQVIHFIFVFFFYAVGIGLTRLVSLVFKKKFLTRDHTTSTWVSASSSMQFKRQY